MLKLCSIVDTKMILFLSADQSGIMTQAVLNGLWYRNRPLSEFSPADRPQKGNVLSQTRSRMS